MTETRDAAKQRTQAHHRKGRRAAPLPAVRHHLSFHRDPVRTHAGSRAAQEQARDSTEMRGRVELRQHAAPGVPKQVKLLDAEVLT